MFSPKENCSPRSSNLKNNFPYLASPRNSQFVSQSLFYDRLQRADQILYHQKSIVKDNIDRLKDLLSEKRQFNRKNRQGLSPQMIFKSPLKNKENVFTPEKGQSRPNTINLSPNKSQQSFTGGISGKAYNQSLITDIKKKIRGSPLRFHEHMAEGRFTKGLISPQSVTFYSDSQIDVNKYLGKLIEQNQMYEDQIMQKDNEIARQTQMINQLQNKLQEYVLSAQKQQEKIHSILFQKDGEMQCLKLEKEQQIKKIKSEFQNSRRVLIEQMCSFEFAHYQKMEDFMKIISKKISTHSQRLLKMNSLKLLELKKQIQLQQSIFVPQNIYRKTKNILQMSPSIKGDSFAQHEDHIVNMEKEMIQFESEIKYKKDKYEEMVFEYEEKYRELEERFFESLRKNQSLKSDIQLLKEEQTKFIKEYEERLQRKKEFQKQHNLSELDQTLPKATPNSVSVEAPNKNLFFKKDPTPFKVQQPGFMTPKHNRPAQSTPEKSIINKTQLNPHQQSYLNMNVKKEEQQSEENPYFDEISRISYKKNEQVNMRELEERVEIELKNRRSQIRRKQDEERHFKCLEREYELDCKQKDLTEKIAAKQKELQIREARLEEQSKLQELYMQEMENIKRMVKLMEEAQLKGKPSGEQSKIVDQSRDPKVKLTAPKKLKQISKVEYLAKKQRKEKQIARTRLQTIERELLLQKSKNAQLQDLIVQNEKNLFGQIRQRATRKDSSKLQQPLSDSESVIPEEQSPFDQRLQTLSKTPRTIEESRRSAEWQQRVKMRLEEAILRLQSLEGK